MKKQSVGKVFVALVVLTSIFISLPVFSDDSATPKEGAIVFALMEEPYGKRNAWIEDKLLFSVPSELQYLGAHAVQSWAEVREKIIELNQEGILIKKMKISAHGTDGTLGLTKNDVVCELLDETTASDFLGPLSAGFAADAEIELAGCYVGRSEKGKAFMLKIAELLLFQNGGTIIAPVSLKWPGVDWLFDDPRHLRVSPGLSTIKWGTSSTEESDDD